MLQFFAMRIKISAIYLKFFFITAKQYCLPISSSIRLTAVPPRWTLAEPVKRLKFGFIFYAQNSGSNHKRIANGIWTHAVIFLYATPDSEHSTLTEKSLRKDQLIARLFLCSKTGDCYERPYNSFFNRHNNKDTALVFLPFPSQTNCLLATLSLILTPQSVVFICFRFVFEPYYGFNA